MQKEIIETILRKTEKTDFWISTESFNILLKNAKEIKLSKEGTLELFFEEGIIGVRSRNEMLTDKDSAYIEVIHIKDDKSNILYKRKQRANYCLIL